MIEEDVLFDDVPMPAWLKAKLSRLKAQGRGKLALGIALAGGDYGCGLCKGYATSGNCLTFMLRERIHPDWSIICHHCAEFLDPEFCRAEKKFLASALGEELNNQQALAWDDLAALRPRLLAQGWQFHDEEYREIVPITTAIGEE
jgi:hypothetical protein